MTPEADLAPKDRLAFEQASRRTGLAFQRTRMSAEQMLMSVIRTSLSLIGFGFTIFQIFQRLYEAELLPSSLAPRRFGESLVALGIAMLVGGIVYHLSFMAGLRAERRTMKNLGLIHAESRYPVSLTLVAAVLLLCIGAAAIGSMLSARGPFG